MQEVLLILLEMISSFCGILGSRTCSSRLTIMEMMDLVLIL